MILFQISYERFIEEIGNEKITSEGKDKLECEDLGNALAYYLTSFDRPKTYVYVVLKSELTEVQKMTLGPLSKLSMRITETSRLIAIAQILERIEQALKTNPSKIIETQTIERIE